MGLSKLSEKCKKCNHKESCDNKRMEACAYVIPKFATGGIVDGQGLFIERERQEEVVINIDFKPSDNFINELQKAMRKQERKCAFRGVI